MLLLVRLSAQLCATTNHQRTFRHLCWTPPPFAQTSFSELVTIHTTFTRFPKFDTWRLLTHTTKALPKSDSSTRLYNSFGPQIFRIMDRNPRKLLYHNSCYQAFPLLNLPYVAFASYQYSLWPFPNTYKLQRSVNWNLPARYQVGVILLHAHLRLVDARTYPKLRKEICKTMSFT